MFEMLLLLIETVCVLFVQASFVMRHQTAIVCVAMFLGAMMLTSSFVLIFTQHINIIHVIALVACHSAVNASFRAFVVMT